MSQKTSKSSDAGCSEKLAPGLIAYMGQRARNRCYDFVLKRFRSSGLTKAELARRLGKGPDRINHLLASPGNWTIDTIAELLLGISEEEFVPTAAVPEQRNTRNMTQADLLAGHGRVDAGTSVNEPVIVDSWIVERGARSIPRKPLTLRVEMAS